VVKRKKLVLVGRSWRDRGVARRRKGRDPVREVLEGTSIRVGPPEKNRMGRRRKSRKKCHGKIRNNKEGIKDIRRFQSGEIEGASRGTDVSKWGRREGFLETPKT